jgi:molecular chaperone GrpE (heat shock protein)
VERTSLGEGGGITGLYAGHGGGYSRNRGRSSRYFRKISDPHTRAKNFSSQNDPVPKNSRDKPEAVAAFSPALGALEAKLEELKCDLNSVMNKPDSHELDDRWSLSMGMLGRLERVLLQMEHAPRTSLWLGTKAWTQAWVDVRKAIEILHHHVVEFMGVHGLERMKVMGCRFDPKTMVAVDHRPSAVAQEGTVIEELFPGFISAGRVIRPAEVMVSKGR